MGVHTDDELDSPDKVELFQREEIVEEDQKDLAPVFDIFTKKRLNINYLLLLTLIS